eukprot:TRINITY_DN13922_c0_g1_i1.p1 TRINITY_DN13922_c0_g1~~TRINITY_DN13922_c0_g1_i1.p1  ORF type:complete len:558 (-),score=140.62 TRINITY_DN13922_c0_g1_i1:125-1798(-)
MSVVCQTVEIFAKLPVVPASMSKMVLQNVEILLSLSKKIGFGRFLYCVVDQRIARTSRGIAKKSDIMGAETSRQESQVLAVGQTARVIVVLSTVVACLPDFNVDIGTLLSFAGFGGLAVSLLSKGLFVNLIGSLTLYLTQPFTLGDWIQIQTADGELDGWVQSMGAYHTVVMRWDRRPLYIPNSRFLQAQIINASRMTNRRVLMEIPLRIADIDKVDKIRFDINEVIQNHKDVDPDMHRIVRLRSIGDYAAMIWVSCYSKSINLKDYVMLREDILLNVKNIMFKYGTTFASAIERQMQGGGWMQEQQAVEPPDSLSTADAADAVDPSSPVASQTSVDSLDPQQKAMLAEELQQLKQMQADLSQRDRKLKDNQENNVRIRESLEKDQKLLEEQLQASRKEIGDLESSLEQLEIEEANLKDQEEQLDSQMEDLQVREEALDQVMYELREKQLGKQPSEQSKGADQTKLEEVDKTRARKQDVEEADRLVDIYQELLYKEKKALEQEKEALEGKRAEISGQQAKRVAQDKKKKAAEQEEEAEEALRGAARTQQIAESLGGE